MSNGNDCQFCQMSHSTFAALQLDGGMAVVDAVKVDPDGAPISHKVRALLAIADAVRSSGLKVTDELVAAARAEGATDVEIHDTVLIAATFCMFNRYVDGLGTRAPDDVGGLRRDGCPHGGGGVPATAPAGRRGLSAGSAAR